MKPCRTHALLVFSLMAATLAAGCLGVADGDTSGLAPLDRQVFDAEVWPILVRDCGFSECHGHPARFFRVFGPGHERLDPTTRLAAPVTEAELQLSYARALSVVDRDAPETSLLLRKPLEVAAGGSGHEGIDSFGRDVYRRVEDPNFQVLVQWVGRSGP